MILAALFLEALICDACLAKLEAEEEVELCRECAKVVRQHMPPGEEEEED